jgi:hypothetical protein
VPATTRHTCQCTESERAKERGREGARRKERKGRKIAKEGGNGREHAEKGKEREGARKGREQAGKGKGGKEGEAREEFGKGKSSGGVCCRRIVLVMQIHRTAFFIKFFFCFCRTFVPSMYMYPGYPGYCKWSPSILRLIFVGFGLNGIYLTANLPCTDGGCGGVPRTHRALQLCRFR